MGSHYGLRMEKINRVQRRALLRSVCANRTVSSNATNILEGTLSTDLLAREWMEQFLRIRKKGAIAIAG